MPSLSQNIEIKGRIINQDGSPVDAAIITINVSGQNERQSLEFLLSDTTSTSGEFVVRFAEMAPDTEIVLADNDKISAIYPNPGGELRGININAVQAGHYRIDIYNSIGGFVANVLNQELPPGNHHVRFNMPDGVASGIYFAKIAGGNQTSIVKFTLVAGSINAQGESGFSETQLIPPDYVIKSASISGGNARLVIPTKVDYDRTVMASINLGDLRVQTVPAAITIKGKAVESNGNPISGIDAEAYFTVNGSLHMARALTNSSGEFSIVYLLPTSEVAANFRAGLDSLVLKGDYVPRTSKILNLPFNNYSAGNIVLMKVPSSVNVSGKTTDVFGEGISVDDIAAHFTINGLAEIVRGSSNNLGNFSLVYTLNPSKVTSDFSAKLDSIVYSGHNVPRQSSVLNRPFNDVSLGDIVLKTITHLAGYTSDLNLWQDGDRSRIGLVPIRFIGKEKEYNTTTDMSGNFSIDLISGNYAIQIGSVADTSRFYIRQTGKKINRGSMVWNPDVNVRETFDEPFFKSDPMSIGYRDLMDVFDELYFSWSERPGKVVRCEKPLIFYLVADTTQEFGRTAYRLTKELLDEKLSPLLVAKEFPEGFLKDYELQCGKEPPLIGSDNFSDGYHKIIFSNEGIGARVALKYNSENRIVATQTVFYIDSNNKFDKEYYQLLFIHELLPCLLGAGRGQKGQPRTALAQALNPLDQYGSPLDFMMDNFVLSREIGLSKVLDSVLGIMIYDREPSYNTMMKLSGKPPLNDEQLIQAGVH